MWRYLTTTTNWHTGVSTAYYGIGDKSLGHPKWSKEYNAYLIQNQVRITPVMMEEIIQHFKYVLDNSTNLLAFVV